MKFRVGFQDDLSTSVYESIPEVYKEICVFYCDNVKETVLHFIWFFRQFYSTRGPAYRSVIAEGPVNSAFMRLADPTNPRDEATLIGLLLGRVCDLPGPVQLRFMIASASYLTMVLPDRMQNLVGSDFVLK
ncbi:hypothetical protein DMUE_0744 [Dictyocoela muelleri]|nr:hypothetical protein DMUE_0744 [Dictyocoela muelleri]